MVLAQGRLPEAGVQTIPEGRWLGVLLGYSSLCLTLMVAGLGYHVSRSTSSSTHCS